MESSCPYAFASVCCASCSRGSFHGLGSYRNSLCVRSMISPRRATYRSRSRVRRACSCARELGEASDTPYREIYADETFGWGAVTQDLIVVDVEGGHSSMLQEPFVESLAGRR